MAEKYIPQIRSRKLPYRALWQRETRWQQDNAPKTERIWGWPLLLILAWIIVLLYIPFVEGAWGKSAFRYSIVLSVLIQSGIVFLLMIRAAGLYRSTLMAAKVIFLTWAIEAIGTATGFPFGSYSYTDLLQPQLLNVPLLIPFAWMMMLPPSWAVAQRLSRSKGKLVSLALGALAFTAWDLFLDPQMVEWDLWIWRGSSGYFGIPWTNFAGWFLSSLMIMIIVKPVSLPERPLILIYSLTWLMETVGLILFWNLKGPALSGFIGMGVFAITAICFGRKSGI
jgi:putative membrane protein